MDDQRQPDTRTPHVFRHDGKDYVSMDEYLRLNQRYRDFYSPQWIPVDERLPEEGVEVWVVAVVPSGKALFHAAAMWRMTPSGRMEWEDEDCVIHHPTHWMKLPSPPKETA